MSIWFYLFLITTIIIIILTIKILVIKFSIKEIEKQIDYIIKSDTNYLMTVSSNDTDIKRLLININNILRKTRKLQIEYERGNQQLKHAITNISHDLRTPLTAISGYLDLVDHKNLTDKQKDYLNFIGIKVKDLTTLTEQLFDFSKCLDTYNTIQKSDVCLNTILEEVVCTSYDLFIKNDIVPNVYITDKKIIKKLDEIMLKRILENIISNEIKYCENTFDIKLKDDGSIEFKNSTKKLDKISAEKIFDRYYTVENAKKSNGIGLSIAKQLVELNNGQIKSEYDHNVLTIIINFQ